jgi:hypothetical protein
MLTPDNELDIQILKERAIAKLIEIVGLTEAELQALGIRSDGIN